MDIRGILNKLRRDKKKKAVEDRGSMGQAMVNTTKNSILWIIDEDGFFLLPTGYQNRDYHTAQYYAIKSLIEDGIIKEKGTVGRSTKWGRVRKK